MKVRFKELKLPLSWRKTAFTALKICLLFLLLERSYEGLCWVLKHGGSIYMTKHIYKTGDKVEVIVNKLERFQGGKQYGYEGLPFTCPSNRQHPLYRSIEEIFRGDRIHHSGYELTFDQDDACRVLCTRTVKPEELGNIERLIRENYKVNWLIDGVVPASTTYISSKTNTKRYDPGFSLGYIDIESGAAYINNHVMIVVRYHSIDFNKNTIIGFEVYPKSVSDETCPGGSKDYEHFEINPSTSEAVTIPFTYSVYWREDLKVDWENRQSYYITQSIAGHGESGFMHWLVISFTFVLLMALTVGFKMMLRRIERNDRAGAIASDWVNLGSRFPLLLNTLVAVGTHATFAFLGYSLFLAPIRRIHSIHPLATVMATLFIFVGPISAAKVARLLSGKVLNNEEKVTKLGIKCGFCMPISVLCFMCIINVIIWLPKGTPWRFPFLKDSCMLTIYSIICIVISLVAVKWHGSVPFAFLKLPPDLFHLKKSSFLSNFHYENHRQSIHPKEKPPIWLLNVFSCKLFTGLIPFALLYLELNYFSKHTASMLTSIYPTIAFIFAKVGILSIVIAGTSIASIYLQLVHRTDLQYSKNGSSRWARVFNMLNSWRWRTFFASGASAWYVLAYCIYHGLVILNYTDFTSIFMYIAYSTLLSALWWCSSGAIGYLACCWFLHRMINNLPKERQYNCHSL
ncbi:HDL288Cp [Eremothecium sinecaudum]|uniref:Transmembrane 9 superfamily member n=1 Tax=Eremothecium sinecaudum TaxID=45286 RepID=A0A0X8HR43_9SACH|nr:HDL288Cp [Eremothecium sinecaudum]AMD20456.1 HDL288Cp [Eremothecium sinecaudum]